jgi:hypothetical protein
VKKTSGVVALQEIVPTTAALMPANELTLLVTRVSRSTAANAVMIGCTENPSGGRSEAVITTEPAAVVIVTRLGSIVEPAALAKRSVISDKNKSRNVVSASSNA